MVDYVAGGRGGGGRWRIGGFGLAVSVAHCQNVTNPLLRIGQKEIIEKELQYKDLH
jgi:hypothetical protein